MSVPPCCVSQSLSDSLDVLLPLPSESTDSDSSGLKSCNRGLGDVLAEIVPLITPPRKRQRAVSLVAGTDGVADGDSCDAADGAPDKNTGGKTEGDSDESAGVVGKKYKPDTEDGPKAAASAGNSAANSVVADHRRHLAERLRRLKAENSCILRKRRDVLFRHRDLWGAYEYGLERISRLNDLRDAPDAVLPGNFPEDGY